MFKQLTLILAIVSVAISCQKTYEEPTITFPEKGQTITMDSLLDLFQGYPIKFTKNLSMYAVVTMDANDGNIYKSVYLADGTKALNLRLLSGGGLYVGDSIRVDLKGTILNQYNGVMQLDSVDIDKNVVKQEVNINTEPLTITLDQLNTSLQSRLIKIENIQFITPQLDSTYADGVNQESYDLTIEDANGNTATLRNSGYANFAKELIAQGSGSITCIVGVFGDNVQLLVRSYSEINMTSSRFPGIQIEKNFDDESITSGGWMQFHATGTEAIWETSHSGGAPNDYAKISNYVDGSKYNTENWLISPAMDISSITSPMLSFKNAFNYTGPTLELYISTDYDGNSNPNTQGTWTAVSFNLASGSWAWADSGNIDLNTFKSTHTHFAFKYTGTTADGSTWEIDDIKIIG